MSRTEGLTLSWCQLAIFSCYSTHIDRRMYRWEKHGAQRVCQSIRETKWTIEKGRPNMLNSHIFEEIVV